MMSSQEAETFQTRIAPNLSVRDGVRAVEFYKVAFGATELSRVTSPEGAIVAEMSVDGARFFLADESPANANLSPESLGGTSVRVDLFAADPDAMHARAVAAGATEIFPVADQVFGYRMGRIKDPFGHHWLIARPLDER